MIQQDILHSLLAEVSRGAPIKGIEIGALAGGTAVHILKQLPQLNWITIDPSPDGSFLQFTEEVRTRIHLIKLPSDDAINTFWVDSTENGKYDFVWVDGDHSYEQVKRDILNYKSLVRKGGLFGGHDYGETCAPGVKQAVDELLTGKMGQVQFADDGVWYMYV